MHGAKAHPARRAWWRQLGGQLMNLLAPPACPLCRHPLDAPDLLCPACWAQLELIEPPVCPATGLPLAQVAGSTAEAAPEVFSEPWDSLRAVAFHTRVARKLVHKLKYHDNDLVLRAMARLMVHAMRDRIGGETLLVPVPLYRWRLWRRRFNQSALLAREMAREAGGVFAPDVLVRTRPTAPQVALSARARRENVRGAFRLAPHWRARLKGASVVLVDDVFTTGATARACARQLKRAGAARVDVAVFTLASRHAAIHI